MFHSKHLHQEVIRVPFILKGPRVTAGRSTTPVQIVDVFPTVLDALDVRAPGWIAGKSVLEEVERLLVSEWYAAPWPRLLDDAFRGRFDRNVRTVRWHNFKLFMDERGSLQLFDLDRDPGESENLADTSPEIVDMLLARDEAWLSEQEPFAPPTAPESPASDPGELERLRALGYIQ